MTDPEVMHGPQGDPLLFAINAGQLMGRPGTTDETTGELIVLLANMGCELGSDGLGSRFERIVDRYGAETLSENGRAFSALGRATTAAILMRANHDVLPADVANKGDDNAAATAVLLKGFMGELAKSNGKPWIDRLVADEVKYQQGRFIGSTSYSAVGAVRYFDHVLDELDLTRPFDRATRLFRALRSIRQFGGDIYA